MKFPDHLLYDKLAWLWPVLSPPGDYQAEAKGVHALIGKRLPSSRYIDASPTLLELGSGGGHMLLHLQEWYDVTGSDLSESMLELSASLNPLVTHYQADMRTLRLQELFDVVLIHDALGYMLSREDVMQALNTANVHLDQGGVLVLLPDEITQTFEDLQEATDNATAPDGRAITLNSHVRLCDDKQSYNLTMTFEITQKDGSVTTETDTHHCGLFSREQWREMLAECGFEAITIRQNTSWRGAPVLTAVKAVNAK